MHDSSPEVSGDDVQGAGESAGRRPMIAVVGDGELEAASPKRTAARQLGTALVQAGFRVACGGRGGVMEAACRGAHAAEAYREGATVGILPGSEVQAANRWVDVVVTTGMNHARNAVVAQAAGVVAVGGGAGTLSEMALAWIHDRMVVALDVEGWSGELAGRRLDERERVEGFAEDRVFGASSAREAVDLLEAHLGRYRDP